LLFVSDPHFSALGYHRQAILFLFIFLCCVFSLILWCLFRERELRLIDIRDFFGWEHDAGIPFVVCFLLPNRCSWCSPPFPPISQLRPFNLIRFIFCFLITRGWFKCHMSLHFIPTKPFLAANVLSLGRFISYESSLQPRCPGVLRKRGSASYFPEPLAHHFGCPPLAYSQTPYIPFSDHPTSSGQQILEW